MTLDVRLLTFPPVTRSAPGESTPEKQGQSEIMAA